MGVGIQITGKIGIFFLNQIDDLGVQFNGIDVLNGVIVGL